MARRRRLMFCSDNHGDLRDSKACRHALDFAKSFKPDVRIHGGDNWDFRWLRKSASKDEQESRITDDLDAGIEFIHHYKPSHFCIGNHDQRIYDRAQTSVGFMSTLCLHVIEKMEAALEGCQIIGPYDKRKFLRMGGWSFGHGWGSGINAARDHAMRFGPIVIGHLHRRERVTAARFDAPEGIISGCLCKISLDYNRAQLNTLAQKHGFVRGEFTSSGRLDLQLEAI